ncbi:MAG: DUF4214 domain-containing protein, partial [Alphaproteobacteria bacterium]
RLSVTQGEVPANTSTSATVSVNGSYSGTLEIIDDEDWIAVFLSGGTSYQFDLEGASTNAGTLIDPYLFGVHDGNGAFIDGTINDDGGFGLNSQLTFTPTSSGTYYIDATSFFGDTGSYRLSVSLAGAVTALVGESVEEKVSESGKSDNANDDKLKHDDQPHTFTGTDSPVDVERIPGNFADQTVEVSGSGSVVVTYTDTVLGLVTVSFTNTERLLFDDGTLAIDSSGNTGQAFRLYQAAFSRAPDSPGLLHNASLMDNGLQLHGLSNAFIVSAEFISLYGADSSNTTFITALYANVLSRAPDEAGFNGWNSLLVSGDLDRADVLIGFSQSLENIALVAPAINDGIWFG